MVRTIERVFIVLIAAIFGVLFFQLYHVLQAGFTEVPARLANGTMINLNAPNSSSNIKTLLQKGYYLTDEKDAALAAAVVIEGLKNRDEAIDNVGELNKSAFYISAAEAYSNGGKNFKQRVLVSRLLLGFSDNDSRLYQQQMDAPVKVPGDLQVDMGSGKISGIITDKNGRPSHSTLVRLKMILPQDSLYSSTVGDVEKLVVEKKPGISKSFVIDTANNRQLQQLIAFASTDGRGRFSFTGLQNNKAYQVLPLQPGYQFGSSKGVTSLNENATFSFIRSPHLIRLFSTRVFNDLRNEKAFIVRTPDEASNWFLIIAIGFIASFGLLHLLLSVRFAAADQFLLPVAMVLTGLSLLTLLSLQDPLRDRFFAFSTFTFFMAGMVGVVLLLFSNLKYFTPDSFLYRLGLFKNLSKAANGWPWAVAASLLLILTIIFGTGPEGSGVKVNLLGVQPSEMVKYLVIIFLAGFFAINEKFISEYTLFISRAKFFAFALLAVLVTIGLFLLLGDLGPAMVCCFTFIVLFSFARGDFAPMCAALVLFILASWLSNNTWLATGISVGASLVYMLVYKKRLSESVVMALVVVASFMLLDQMPLVQKLFPGPVQRLIDRKAIWQDPWNNEVFGGDQVANGIWAMASGGITGQGVGEGFAKTIPEAHTDMVLPAIGEEFGYAGILAIFLVFFVLLHRAIVIGRQTGRPFLFFLAAGIGIATFIQFVLIAGGSTGALPLSGVALPFISYGGSSLIINMLALGFLLSASLLRGSAAQMKYITQQHDKNIVPALLAACTGIILLGFNASKYLVYNNRYIVEPALVADRGGSRMFSYNPRINILMKRLQAGDILDRKGRVVATSNPMSIQQQLDSLLAAGISPGSLYNTIHSRADRYYPFNEQLFFWIGDANTGVFNGSVNGYFAEYEHAAALRGFPTPNTNFTVPATRFKEDRFLAPAATEMTVSKRDYSALAYLLLAGINSPAVENFKQQNRDVQLTIDAALQTNLQQALSTDDSVRVKRVSVVVLEDDTGDVLASAAWPLPPVDNWELLTLSPNDLNKLPGWNVNSDQGFTYATQPGSTAKLVTSLAAFNKLGTEAATKKILIRPADLIRTRGLEPDEAGYIDIQRAIVKSNNSFFIRLANEAQLQEQMGTVYLQTGMFLHGVGGYYYRYNNDNSQQEEKWQNVWRKTEFASAKKYDPNNIYRTRGKGISGMAWGQGELIATPAAVARVASAIANHGLLMPDRYVISISGKKQQPAKGMAITRPAYADFLKSYMLLQSAGKATRLKLVVAGKTGTPERIWNSERINDGWYVFFAPKANGKGHIVTCIRLEATKGSSEAVRLAGQYVIPVLKQRGYIKSFEAVKPLPTGLPPTIGTVQGETDEAAGEQLQADTIP